MKHVTKNDKDLWTMATYTCIRDEMKLLNEFYFWHWIQLSRRNSALASKVLLMQLIVQVLKIIFDINGNIKEI
jgi:hypothetical protein